MADAASGERRAGWAASRMRLLSGIAEQFVASKPFDDLTIGVSLHLEPKTVALIRALQSGGASVVATGNLGTTQADIVAALNSSGVIALGTREDDAATHLGHVDEVVGHGPDILLDNDADLIAAALDKGVEVRGATEETTSGQFRLRDELAVPYPVIVINDSPLKEIVENKHAVGQSVMESFLRITNLMVQGKRFVVAGYGWCGRGIAHYARSLGADVTVVEVDEIKALEAAVDGFRVEPMEAAAQRGMVFITATGARGVVSVPIIELMPEGAILANAGHFDFEIDVPGLTEAASKVEDMGDAIERYTLAGGKSVVLLAGGRMVNLAGVAPKGNSIESMDLGFALQALSLERIATAAETLSGGPQPVPDDINRRTAAAMVRQMMA